MYATQNNVSRGYVVADPRGVTVFVAAELAKGMPGGVPGDGDTWVVPLYGLAGRSATFSTHPVYVQPLEEEKPAHTSPATTVPYNKLEKILYPSTRKSVLGTPRE